MSNNLFQNDNITGNSLIGIEIKGSFKDDEDVLLDKIKNAINRDITFITSDYKLMTPTETHAVVVKDCGRYVIKTPMYSYFEAIFLLPKIFEFLKGLKSYKNSYVHFKIGFNGDVVTLSKVNILKFILEYKEDMIFKLLGETLKKNNIKKITSIYPTSLDNCEQLVQKQVDGYKYLTEEDDIFGLSFANINDGYLLFKYTENIDYRNKWEEIMKCLNHTIITLYNTSVNTEFDEDEIEKVQKINNSFKEHSTTFGCYEMFNSKYKSIKLSVDLATDKSLINMIYPSIKDMLFNLTIRNEIKEASINYDSDVSRLQIKDVDLKECYNLAHIDIVNCDIEDAIINDCDIYDSNIKNSTLTRCNLFGFANCNDSDFENCFINRNIQLKNCDVHGQLGKMGGSMIGGSLKNTTIILSSCDINDNVEKENVNEIQ